MGQVKRWTGSLYITQETGSTSKIPHSDNFNIFLSFTIYEDEAGLGEGVPAHSRGGWNWMIFKAPSNPNCSVILGSVGDYADANFE